MNKRNDYKTLLKTANDELKTIGKELILKESDGQYELLIQTKGNPDNLEYYAGGYYEDELEELINEAWHDAKQKPSDDPIDSIRSEIRKLPDEKITELLAEEYQHLPDYWKDRFLEITDNR